MGGTGELSLLLSLDHPNVVKCFEWFEDRGGEKVFIVTEICTGGELVELLVRKDVAAEKKPKMVDVASQILSAVAYCHGLGVVHRDLKLENCLLKDESSDALVKVIDFG